ncbi:MAG: NnrS family protein [Gammaproteobacteria bacterium]|nr:NnrS family protein [Gammaproteobacteria bacterium]
MHAFPLLSHGIRPFFLGAALWAVAGMALWIAALTGHAQPALGYGLLAWHAHEFLFGYVGAVLSGFLLTAATNWTGRASLSGTPLLALFGLWLAGRITLYYYAVFGAYAVGIDVALLLVMASWFAREIILARDWLNLRVVALILALAASNVAFHVEVLRYAAPGIATRLALALIVALIMVIGGRITPTFTRNWLIARKRPPYPAIFDRVDALAIAVGVLALIGWILWPQHATAGWLLLLAGGAQSVRLARWRGRAALGEPLVLILHVGYAFVPLGFVATGIAVLRPDLLPATGALHAWTAGAIGVTTLGVMTRVTLSDTGRPPRAPPATLFIYAAAILAALTRVFAPLSAYTLTLYVAAAIAWIVAFGGFLVVYGPFLLRASED